ncbi:MAG: glycosyltransferase [Candidatus Gastranaerophilales bacterium]|nr:glycosyltransferase [Candidatus Gastranaerophilales bacterium]
MLSIVIPTLQKNKEILYNLIDSLDTDKSVGEILIIDNSLKGIDYISQKVRVITPSENLYVNPSWNLGVKEAKYDIVALFNDDISVSEDFCTNVISKMIPNMGIVGFNSGDYMEVCDKFSEQPQKSIIELEPIKYMDKYFGVAMFFFKSAYAPIPNDMKIVYGDNWLIYNCQNNKRICYRINGQKILHIGSLSSSNPKLKPICKNDSKIYKKLTMTFKKRMMSFENCWDCYKLRLFGLTFKIRKHKEKGVNHDKTGNFCTL